MKKTILPLVLMCTAHFAFAQKTDFGVLSPKSVSTPGFVENTATVDEENLLLVEVKGVSTDILQLSVVDLNGEVMAFALRESKNQFRLQKALQPGHYLILVPDGREIEFQVKAM